MKFKNINIILLSLIVVYFNYCTFNSKNKPMTKNSSNDSMEIFHPSTDTIIKPGFPRDISINYPGDNNYSFKLSQNIIKKAGLANIANGYDSIFIRLFYFYSFDSRVQIIEINKNDSMWFGTYKLIYFQLEKMDSILSIQGLSIKKQPKNGWPTFSQTLFKLNITTLPDDSTIPEFDKGPADGNFVIVEVSTKKLYRLYSYINPNYFKDIPEAKSIEAIMSFIDEEFEIERIRPI